jgi:hypothetical protein
VGTLEIQSAGCRIIVAVSPNGQASQGEDFRVIPPGRIWDVDSALEITLRFSNHILQLCVAIPKKEAGSLLQDSALQGIHLPPVKNQSLISTAL